MKNILIDIYKIKNIYTGLGQYSLQLSEAIKEKKQNDFSFSFLVPKKYTMPGSSTIESNWLRRCFSSGNKGFDLWHSIHQFPSILPDKKTPLVLTVHDLNFLTDKSNAKQKRYLNLLQKNINRAAAVTAISNYTKKLLETHINLKGKNVEVVHNGVNALSQPLINAPSYIGNKTYLLCIGVFKHTKNLHVLLPMMQHIDDKVLILAGDYNTAYGHQLKKKISELKLDNKIIFSGPVGGQEKAWLFANCSALLFPSIAEGFGIPLIEAMQLGKPVFISNYTSLPEIGGKYANIFPSFEPKIMADFVYKKLNEYKLNTLFLSSEMKKYAAQFSWQNTINEYMKIYKKVLQLS